MRVQIGTRRSSQPPCTGVVVSIRERLREDRPMVTISLQIPADVFEELQHIAPKLGFSGYTALIRAYIGRGLRRDGADLRRDTGGGE